MMTIWVARQENKKKISDSRWESTKAIRMDVNEEAMRENPSIQSIISSATARSCCFPNRRIAVKRVRHQ